MPADEVTHGTDVDGSRGRTGPRHAAPRKPLFTRFHMPAGKAIALAAMPTAVLMGMGFTPTLARADDDQTTKTLTAEEYQKCVEVLDGTEDGTDTAATPSASTSSSSSDDEDTATEPSPSATATDSDSGSSDDSSDSGSDDTAEPTPTPSASKTTSSGGTGGGSDTATPTPSASASATEESGGLLETIGDAITGIFTGETSSSDSTSTSTTESTETTGTTESTETTGTTESATPTPAASPAASAEAGSDDSKDTTDSTTVKDTTAKVTEVLKDSAEDTTKAAEDTTEAAADEATATPSPSASETTDADDCPAATDDEGGVDNSIRLPVDPWTLEASSLTLKGADYKGIVKVRTADGTVKEVLKYVISDGTDIGDLHQLVKDDTSGKTYHVQAGKGTTSTITGGETIMYTESISGNLFGLIPITFDPKNPPPLNIPLIYFTKVTVTQAGQFGGTLEVPGLHQYTT
ncbi:hypothetical protein [Streptomyces sp. GQFP]|uniref:hypothetical protein n=1 Tax=Streptomyces sp. GQFP TaxID=2907545 RepID=UPI001F25E631|nr:hypothetical protein [Streptomyces sp. GQFP]UIX30683.1 hypothetical protein LUX31_11950 [Streptomyces sp. GQFP]